MILAKDLRIGNKFLGIAGVQTVLDILDNTDLGKIEYVSDYHKSQYSHLIQVEENRNQYKPCEIDGVSLSEEILLKCGFEKKSSVIFTLGKCMLYLGANFADFYYAGHFNKVIHSLHELQNGYHWHESKELEIAI